MADARHGAASVKRRMPAFVASLHSLEQARQNSHERLNRELAARGVQVEQLARHALIQVALAGLLILLFVTLLIVWLRKRIMRPLLDIVAAIRTMNEGHPLAPLPMAADRDEIGELARGLDLSLIHI